AVDSFSFTANNITYAAAGDMLGYWQFYPPVGEDSAGWGVIPVWGFANVIDSRCDQITAGERLFGYFPPATHVVMQPTRITEHQLMEGSAHRAELPPAYNSYTRIPQGVGADQRADKRAEAERMLLWPLHITSFCLWDALKDKQWHQAQQIIILSASSKTSIGLAYALANDPDAPPAVALTSSHNLPLVKQLEVYEQAMTYDELDQINTSLPTVIVDMSGNSALLKRLAQRLGENLNYSIRVGLTHWAESQGDAGLDETKSEFFFVPSYIQKRMKDWGPQGFSERSERFMHASAAWSRNWLKIRTVEGLSGLAEIYPAICQGKLAADEGVVVAISGMNQNKAE
ncbi:DUF2855 family protein, partial [Marinobacter antarcticus]